MTRNFRVTSRGLVRQRARHPGNVAEPRDMRPDGWASSYADDSAIPGVSTTSFDGRTYTSKQKWITPLFVPHGSFKMEGQKARNPLGTCPEGGLEETVADVAGIPTSSDPAAAARWAVERRARYDSDYRIDSMPDVTPKLRPQIRPVGAVASILRQTRLLRAAAAADAAAPEGAPPPRQRMGRSQRDEEVERTLMRITETLREPDDLSLEDSEERGTAWISGG